MLCILPYLRSAAIHPSLLPLILLWPGFSCFKRQPLNTVALWPWVRLITAHVQHNAAAIDVLGWISGQSAGRFTRGSSAASLTPFGSTSCHSFYDVTYITREVTVASCYGNVAAAV